MHSVTAIAMAGNTVAVVIIALLLLDLSTGCVCGRPSRSKRNVQDVYNFTCDLTPVQHDRIKQQFLNKLMEGKAIYIYIYTVRKQH